MKKLLLPILLFVFLLVSALGQVYAQEESSNKITCDEVWKIVGTKDCPDWAVNNDLGGVWCNITSLERAPWTAGLAPKYTFTPGTCTVEEADQPQQVPSQNNNLAKEETPKQEEDPIIQLVRDWTMETKTVPLIGALRFSDPSGVPKDLERFTSVTGKNLEETLNWQSLNTEEVLPNYIPGKENITVVKGQGEVKSPTSTQFILMNPMGGDTLQATYLDSTVRSTSDAMQIQYIWAVDSGSVINVPKWTEIKFLKPVRDEKTQEIKRMLKLDKGELEIKVKNIDPKNKLGIQGDFFDLFVVQTHFWVSQSQDKKMAVVGVYEGEVEVKTKDGKVVKVKPDGDKPGVVIVSQEFSPFKLVLAGLALAGVIGSILLFLKRKRITKKK